MAMVASWCHSFCRSSWESENLVLAFCWPLGGIFLEKVFLWMEVFKQFFFIGDLCNTSMDYRFLVWHYAYRNLYRFSLFAAKTWIIKHWGSLVIFGICNCLQINLLSHYFYKGKLSYSLATKNRKISGKTYV